MSAAPFDRIETKVVDHAKHGPCVRVMGLRSVRLSSGIYETCDGHEVVHVKLSAHGGDVEKATAAATAAFNRIFVVGDGSAYPRPRGGAS